MSLVTCSDCGTQVSRAAESCPKCGRKFNRTSPVTWGCAGLFALVFFGICYNIGTRQMPSRVSTQANASTPAPQPVDSGREAAKHVAIKKFSYSRSEGGLRLIASLTVQNENDFPVKDLRVTCVEFSKTETPLRTIEHTIYERIGAHKSRRVSEEDMGFLSDAARSIACHVDNLTTLAAND